MRAAVGRMTVVLGMIAVVVIAAAGLAIEDQAHPGTTTTLSSYSSSSSTVATSSLLASSSSTTSSSTLYPNPGGASTTQSTSSLQQSVTCIISGQPGPIFIRVLSDSNQTVAGAQVAATSEPGYCGSTPAGSQSTVTFTTSSGTEWYPLNSQNSAGYSFVVTYAGQNYSFTAALRPVLATCTTLYVPSGRTSISIVVFQNSSTACTFATTTTTSSSQQPASLTWYASYGVWNYAVTLTTNEIQPGQNITALFQLTNMSNETQTVDLGGPMVLPTIYAQDGKVVWAYQPSADTNAVQNVAAGRVLSEQLTLPTSMLSAGQSYILSSSPDIGNPGFTVNIGSHLELNETITVT